MDENDNKFTKNQKIMREIAIKKIGYPKGSTIPKFRKNLRKMGYRFRKHINMESFCQEYPKETRELILDNYKKSNILSDKSFYILCLIHPENLDLFEIFMSEFNKYQYQLIQIDSLCNKLSELLYVTKDIKYRRKYKKYLYGSSEKDWLGKYKLDIMKICGEFQLEEAIPYMVQAIQYETGSIRNAALESLKKYDVQERFREIYELYPYDERNLMKQMEEEYIKTQDEFQSKNVYPKDSCIPEFIENLEKTLCITIDEVDVQKICQENPTKTVSLIKRFYKKSSLQSDKIYLAECFNNHNNTNLFSFLVKELEKYQNIGNDLENIIASIQLFLLYTSDISLKDNYISLLKDKKMYFNLGCIIEICNKLKIKEVEPDILEIAKDKKNIFCAEALQYLCQCRNTKKYKEIFEMHILSPYDDVRESARMGIALIDKRK